MIKDKLPILISVPHGGLNFPTQIQTECLLSDMDILLDGDTWTKELFDFSNLAEEYHQVDVARIFVDMNRDLTDLPPENTDGIVKTMTVEGKMVWDSPSGLSDGEREALIDKYYLPYHQKLIKAAENPDVKLAVDCHSMLDYGPGKKGVNWENRPLFCIGNRGNDEGDLCDEALTAPMEMMVHFKELLEAKFHMYKANNREFVTMNDPFKGGHVTRLHGNIGKVPWIQLEVNRVLYLPPPSLISLRPNDLQQVKLVEFRNLLYDVFSELVKDVHPGKAAL
ncbi:N-formylglutamate amidohydrolase [Salipaludibacillus sp. HK11]|uniref:N-formylglutamate amidohydrolase n=1 Tax=Salipaludibacillus sp. HK11 TaxID=3394320 RepID=UPI0039FD1E0A